MGFGYRFINGVGYFGHVWSLQIVPGLILILGRLFISESPRWLAKQGYQDIVEQIVENVQAKGNREDPDFIIEICEIKEQMFASEKFRSFAFADLFTKKYR